MGMNKGDTARGLEGSSVSRMARCPSLRWKVRKGRASSLKVWGTFGSVRCSNFGVHQEQMLVTQSSSMSDTCITQIIVIWPTKFAVVFL